MPVFAIEQLQLSERLLAAAQRLASLVLLMKPEVRAEPLAPAPSVNHAVSDASKLAVTMQRPPAKDQAN